MQKTCSRLPRAMLHGRNYYFPALALFFARERIGLYYDVGTHKIFHEVFTCREAVIRLFILFRRLSCVLDLHFHR